MKTHSTLIMIIVALALGAYFLFFDTPSIDNGQPTTPINQLGQPLIKPNTLKPTAVPSITLTLNNQPPINFQQNPASHSWRQSTPIDFDIYDDILNNLIDYTAALRYTSTLTPDATTTLERLGLSPPRATLTFNRNDASPITLQFGNPSAAGLAYLKHNNTIYAVDDTLHAALFQVDPSQWRNQSLTSFNAGQTTLIKLTTPTSSLELSKTNSQWNITQPRPYARADRNAAQQLASVLASATITQFVKDNPDDLALYNLTEPTATLTLQMPNPTSPLPTTHTLTIGGPQNLEKTHYFATYNNIPAVFTLPKSTLDQLLIPFDSFRDKRLTPVSRADINAIKITRHNQAPIAFKLNNTTWVFESPDTGYAPEPDRIKALIDTLFNTTATAFADTSTKKLAAPLATVTLGLAGQNSEVIRLHDYTQGNLLVIRAGEALGYVVPHNALAAVFDNPLDYHTLTAIDITPDQLASIQLIRSGAYPANYTINRQTDQPTQWNLTNLNAPAIQKLLTHIAPLRATEWLNDAPITTPEGVTLKLTLNDATTPKNTTPKITTPKNITHEIHIHTDSLTATSLSNSSTAFKISPALATLLNSEFRNTRPLNLDADQITEIAFPPYILRRDSLGAFTLTGGDINPTQAATLFNTLTSLTAIHYINTTPTTPPTATLQITTTNQTQHTLKIWLSPPGNNTPGNSTPQPIAQLNNRVFTLSPPAAKNLTTPPTK